MNNWLEHLLVGLIPYLLGCLIVWLVLRGNGKVLVKRFTGAIQIELSPDMAQQVEPVLLRAARIRRAALLSGPIALATVGLLWEVQPWMSFLANPFFMLGCYISGVMVAALTVRLPHEDNAAKTALLAPRRLSDYLPSWIVWTIRAATAVAVGLGALAIANHKEVLLNSPDRYDVANVAWIMALPVITLAVFEVFSRVLLSRPQLAGSVEAGLVDDAMRLVLIRRIGRAVVTFAAAAMAFQFWAYAQTFDDGNNFVAGNLLRLAGVVAIGFTFGVYIQSSAENAKKADRLLSWTRS